MKRLLLTLSAFIFALAQASADTISSYPTAPTPIRPDDTVPMIRYKPGANPGSPGSWVNYKTPISTFAPTTVTGAVYAPTNAALMALATTAATSGSVTRQGVTVTGDAPPLTFNASPSPCSITLGDVGTQVPASDGGCWLANPPPEGEDVREWGAVADGTNDQLAPFNKAIASGVCVIVPPSVFGFYISSLTVTSPCFGGVASSPASPQAGYAGTSWIKCAGAANTACLVHTADDGKHSPGLIENLTLVGAPTTANSGSIGYQVIGGIHASTYNLQVVNFDTCDQYGPTTIGIHVENYNLTAMQCQTYFHTLDGFPEVYYYGGRDGGQASSDYTVTSAVFYLTHSAGTGSGAGPNGLNVIGRQMNPGGASTGVACAIRFGGWTVTGGVQEDYKFIGDRFEFVPTNTGGTQGMVCADSTVPAITGLVFADSIFQTDVNPTVPIFNISQGFTGDTTSGSAVIANATLTGPTGFSGIKGQFVFGAGIPANSYIVAVSGTSVTFDNAGHLTATASATGVSLTAATDLRQSHIHDNYQMSCSDLTLNLPTSSAGSAFENTIAHNKFSCPVSFTSNGSQVLNSIANGYGAFTLSGSWATFNEINDNFSTSTTTGATGLVSWTNAKVSETAGWTPSFSFAGGGSVTFTSQSTLSRSPGGGFWARLYAAASAVSSPSGALTISGIPFTCASGANAGVPSALVGFTGLTGQVVGQISTASPATMFLAEASSTGSSSIQGSNFTSSSGVQVQASCNTTQ